MVCGKSLDTATLKRSVVLENRISILSLDTFLLFAHPCLFVNLSVVPVTSCLQAWIPGEIYFWPVKSQSILILELSRYVLSWLLCSTSYGLLFSSLGDSLY
jgi:hypothetical protein